MINEQIETP